MELMEKISSAENIAMAISKVKHNHGAPGIDEMTVEELDSYFSEHGQQIISEIRQMKYKPKPVKRVYIPKPDGNKRPLGIPCVVDRVIQQAVAQQLVRIYDKDFSNHSYGYRPNRDAQQAIKETLNYLNSGYQWVIDMDIKKFFDTVNQDKLISELRKRVEDRETLHLIRTFLKSGVLEDGLTSPSNQGVVQGSPLSPVLSNIYLDKLDKELESRGLRFTRYADDTNVYVGSEKAANRVIKSLTGWIERKLLLKVNLTKTQVVRPTKSNYLGFTYWKNGKEWKCKPRKQSKGKLYAKIQEYLKRNRAVARPIGETFTKVNQIVRGWINYYQMGNMKVFLDKFGQWLRHKIRVILIKQWKRPQRIYTNLQKLNKVQHCGFSHEDVFKVANSRLGWYRKCGMNVVNCILNPSILERKRKDRPGLINPLNYYLGS